MWWSLAACVSATDTDTPPSPQRWRVMTFNTGTTTGLPHEAPPDDGYGPAEAAISDQHYGDGLAWQPAVAAVERLLAEVAPDVIAFQEIFDPTECPSIPLEAHPGFVCETWTPGDATVAQRVTGEGYAVACHPGKPDKCVAIHERLGPILAVDGVEIDGCGSGSRVASFTLDAFVVVSVHGSSGVSPDDQACRVAQVEAVFELATGEVNLVLGDLNTDPGRFTAIDDSALAWSTRVGPGLDFSWLTDIGPDATPTYQGLVNIDHVASDGLTGRCETLGLEGEPVYDGVYFDHLPVVCDLERASSE